jgi:hypothetical protein
MTSKLFKIVDFSIVQCARNSILSTLETVHEFNEFVKKHCFQIDGRQYVWHNPEIILKTYIL